MVNVNGKGGKELQVLRQIRRVLIPVIKHKVLWNSRVSRTQSAHYSLGTTK